jgi:hypothetical protein
VEELIKKIDELVEAIYALVATMDVEHEENEDERPQTYLDGTRREV